MNEQEKKAYIIGAFFIPLDDYVKEMIKEGKPQNLKQFITENGSVLEFPDYNPPRIVKMTDEEFLAWDQNAVNSQIWRRLDDMWTSISKIEEKSREILHECIDQNFQQESDQESLRHAIDRVHDTLRTLLNRKPWYVRLLNTLSKPFKSRRNG